MKKSINIFGKQIALYKIIVFVVFFTLYSIYTLIEQPFVGSLYLKNDVKNFKENYSWKIYLVLWIFFVIFSFYKIEKKKEAIGELGMLLLLYLVAGFFLFNSIITTNALIINQLQSTEAEIITYEVYNRDKYISLTEINNKENISEIVEDEILNKIEKNRVRNRLKPLNQIKHGDTVNVIFDKGLFGFKYLN